MQTPARVQHDNALAGLQTTGVVYMRRCPRDALVEPLGVVLRFAQQPERVRRRRYRPTRGWVGVMTDRFLDSAYSLVSGRHDGRRQVVNRLRLIAAVGAVAMFTAVLGGSSAYGGSSSPAQGNPIKLGVLTPLTANFAPWGIQVRAGRGARGERDQQVGRREGARSGATDQPRRRGRPVHEHQRGHRGLQAADAAGRRRLGRGHHRKPDRARDHAARRGSEGAVVPREVG